MTNLYYEFEKEVLKQQKQTFKISRNIYSIIFLVSILTIWSVVVFIFYSIITHFNLVNIVSSIIILLISIAFLIFSFKKFTANIEKVNTKVHTQNIKQLFTEFGFDSINALYFLKEQIETVNKDSENKVRIFLI